jgi:hypothetical protein
MHMKRTVFLILLLCLIVQLADAQQLWKRKRYEAGAGIGPSFFFGDIGGFSRTKNILGLRDLTIKQTRADLNLNLKYRITQEINVRLSLTYGFLNATDTRGSNPLRGYEAAISIFEPAVIGEYYFIKNKAENLWRFSKSGSAGLRGIMSSLDFYAFTGIGGVSYNIKANDKLVDYYKKNPQLIFKPNGFAAIIPVGLGATLIFSPNFNFGVEVGGRYAFSDNIDGYTSQHSSSNDVYYFFNFTITYKLKTGSNGLPTFR